MSRPLTANYSGCDRNVPSFNSKFYLPNDKREHKHPKERNIHVVGARNMAQAMHRTRNDGGQFAAGVVWQACA